VQALGIGNDNVDLLVKARGVRERAAVLLFFSGQQDRDLVLLLGARAAATWAATWCINSGRPEMASLIFGTKRRGRHRTNPAIDVNNRPSVNLFRLVQDPTFRLISKLHTATKIRTLTIVARPL
jgi:hypothetical protein